MQENKSALAHQIGVYQKCLRLNVKDLKGKYAKSFNACIEGIKAMAEEIVENSLPVRNFEEDEVQKKYDTLRSNTKYLLTVAALGWVNVAEDTGEEFDAKVSEPFYIKLEECVKKLTDWEMPKKVVGSHSTPISTLKSVTEIRPGDNVITHNDDYSVEELQAVTEKTVKLLKSDGNTAKVETKDIWRIDREGKTIFRRLDPVAEDAWKKRQEEKATPVANGTKPEFPKATEEVKVS